MNAVFKETQKFSDWILWGITIVLVPIGLLTLYGIYQQMILGEPFGTKPGSDLSLILTTLLLFGLVIFLWALSLKTEINSTSIKIHFFPLMKREVFWEQISKAEIVDYGFVWGWGIRLTHKYGTVYNTKGQIGLAIELKNGKKLLIGTQKRAELETFLKEKQLIG